VAWLKEEFARQVPEHSKAESFIFIIAHAGEELGSKHALWEYGLQDGAHLFLELSEAGIAAAVGKVKVMRKAGVDAKGIKEANFTPQLMRAGGFTVAETASVFGPAELKEGGSTLKEIRQAVRSSANEDMLRDFSIVRLLHAGFTVKDMRLAGVKATELIGAELHRVALPPGADGVTVPYYVLDGRDMKAVGNRFLLEDELVETRQMHRKTHTEWMHSQIDDGRPVYLESSTIERFTPVRPAARPEELKDGGYSIKELRSAGYTAAQLREAGVSAKDMMAAGFRIVQLKEAGYAAAELSQTGTGRL